MIVNRNEISEILGVTPPTIDSWVSKGMPIYRNGCKGTPAQFNIRDCIQWNTKSKRDSLNSDALKLRNLAAETTLAELHASKAKSEIVSASDVETVFNQIINVLSSHLLKLPESFPKHYCELREECESILSEASRNHSHMLTGGRG